MSFKARCPAEQIVSLCDTLHRQSNSVNRSVQSSDHTEETFGHEQTVEDTGNRLPAEAVGASELPCGSHVFRKRVRKVIISEMN